MNDQQLTLDLKRFLLIEQCPEAWQGFNLYLFRDEETLELCATEGLKPEAVHQTRMRMGEGLVGRVALTGAVINTDNAPAEPGFR
jgi:signal transduction protein with GAF and PtsI domain